MGERFFLGFEKRAGFKLDEGQVWKAKHQPEEPLRNQIHTAIHKLLKKNEKNLSPEGLEELKGMNEGVVGPNDSMWHPRYKRV